MRRVGCQDLRLAGQAFGDREDPALSRAACACLPGDERMAMQLLVVAAGARMHGIASLPRPQDDPREVTPNHEK